jgi:type IX secretion system PorP/SprF family membrane protein
MFRFLYTLFIVASLSTQLRAQGLHFSQYFNAPQLLNPANTALMPLEDFSMGANYREQWKSVPAPFTTIAAHADMQLMRNKNITNWMGLGFAFFSDKAGQGILSLDKIQASLAYHVQMQEYSMLSAGVSVSYVQRSIDFNRLTFDMQWDGFKFNPKSSQHEPYVRQSLNYIDVMLGANYAYFPNENVYFKIGAGLMNVTRPKESFYDTDSRVGMRPVVNIDLLMKSGDNFIINPSVYYTRQRGASELVFGSLFNLNLGAESGISNAMVAGIYYRMGESFIPMLGMEFSRFRWTISYDITASQLSVANRSKGAFEIGVIYKGFYSALSRGRDSYNCPRF